MCDIISPTCKPSGFLQQSTAPTQFEGAVQVPFFRNTDKFMEKTFFNPKIMSAFCRVCAKAGVELEFEHTARLSPNPMDEARQRIGDGYRILEATPSGGVVFTDTMDGSDPTELMIRGVPHVAWAASSKERLGRAYEEFALSNEFLVLENLSVDNEDVSAFMIQYVGSHDLPMQDGPIGQILIRNKKIFGVP